jgi:Holliday junction resolvase RusA-like endonuclease
VRFLSHNDGLDYSKATVLHLRVEGEAKAQGRPRAFQRGGQVRVYNPSTAEYWKSQIAMECKLLPRRIDGPIIIDILWLFQMPKSKRTKKWQASELRLPMTSKPDRDNLDKAVLDTLTSIGVIVDDARVFDGRLTKLYAAPTDAPGAEIAITYWPQ